MSKTTFRIPIHTGSAASAVVGSGRPYVCKSVLAEIFDSRDIPTICDAVLQPRKNEARAPNSSAVKIRIPVGFEGHGVDYQAYDKRWVQRRLLVHDADNALHAAGVPTGDYWLWLERD